VQLPGAVLTGILTFGRQHGNASCPDIYGCTFVVSFVFGESRVVSFGFGPSLDPYSFGSFIGAFDPYSVGNALYPDSFGYASSSKWTDAIGHPVTDGRGSFPSVER